MLPVRVNGRVQQNEDFSLRGFQDKILKFLMSLKSQKILGYKENHFKGKINAIA